MSQYQIKKYLKMTPQWVYCVNENTLNRAFKFDNFEQTIIFVNELAEIANKEDHHPRLQLTYNYCKVSYNTHTVNGVTENDFICAAKIDLLAAS